MTAAVLYAVASASTPGVDLSQLSQDDVQTLLVDWELDGTFADVFSAYQINGFGLSLVPTDDDCTFGKWLVGNSEAAKAAIPPIAWSALCERLRTFGGDARPSRTPHSRNQRPQQQGRRRVLTDRYDDVVNISDFSGISVSRDRAMLSLGPEADVVLARKGVAELLLLASDVSVPGGLNVNGSATFRGGVAGVTTIAHGTRHDNECNSTHQLLFDDGTGKLYVCNSTDWVALLDTSSGSSSGIMRSCLTADAEGLYDIQPVEDGEFYAVFCHDDGGMRLRSAYDTYSTYFSQCGGVLDADCLPSASQGCTVKNADGSDSGVGCDSGDLAHTSSYQAVVLEYVDESGKAFEDDDLAALSVLYTTSGNAATAWLYDSADKAGYQLHMSYAGSATTSSFWTSHYAGGVENSWGNTDDLMGVPSFLGEHRIPTVIDAGSMKEFGIALVLPSGGALRLTPLAAVRKSCLGADEGKYLLDPARTGNAFVGMCDGDDNLILNTDYDSYNTYYEKCGGAADSDCTPTCTDNCTMERQNGDLLEACCDSDNFTSLSGSREVSINYIDELGFMISQEQLDGLVESGIDTSNSNIKLWLFDATDTTDYDLTFHFHGATPSRAHLTDYYIGSDVNKWDLNEEVQPDLLGLLQGYAKIPSGIHAGNQKNIGIWTNFPEKRLIVAAAPKSCASVDFEGTVNIDPAGTGKAFPVHCDGSGRTHLRSAFDGYSVYYKKCGGNADADCIPNCAQGCALRDVDNNVIDGCCDDGDVKAGLGSVKFEWIDEDDNSIDDEQLHALALISDSSWSSARLYQYDSDDNDEYDSKVTFYGYDEQSLEQQHKNLVEDTWYINSDNKYCLLYTSPSPRDRG